LNDKDSDVAPTLNASVVAPLDNETNPDDESEIPIHSVTNNFNDNESDVATNVNETDPIGKHINNLDRALHRSGKEQKDGADPSQKKKRSEKVLKSKDKHEMEPSKRPRRSSRKTLQVYDHAFFDDHYHKGTLKHKTAARMMYDPVLETFWYSNVIGNIFTQAMEVEHLEGYDDLLVNEARRVPNEWVGCSIGDPIDERIPAHLSTTKKMFCEQNNKRFCLTYSLASALWYCGLETAAKVLQSQACAFASLSFDNALNALIGLMPGIAPEIGRPTIYNQRRCLNKTRIKARRITWDILYAELVPHPTLVIAVMPNETPSHALCIVDDLIFDSSFPFALKLKKESIEWIFNDCEVDIYQAFRFNTKCSPQNVKVEAKYTRLVELNWDMPSRLYIKRTSHDWHLPHYIIEDRDEPQK